MRLSAANATVWRRGALGNVEVALGGGCCRRLRIPSPRPDRIRMFCRKGGFGGHPLRPGRRRRVAAPDTAMIGSVACPALAWPLGSTAVTGVGGGATTRRVKASTPARCRFVTFAWLEEAGLGTPGKARGSRRPLWGKFFSGARELAARACGNGGGALRETTLKSAVFVPVPSAAAAQAAIQQATHF